MSRDPLYAIIIFDISDRLYDLLNSIYRWHDGLGDRLQASWIEENSLAFRSFSRSFLVMYACVTTGKTMVSLGLHLY